MRISFMVTALRQRLALNNSETAQTPPTTPPEPPIETPEPSPAENPPLGPQEIPQPDPAPLPNQTPPQAKQKCIRMIYRNRTWLIRRQRAPIHPQSQVIEFDRDR